MSILEVANPPTPRPPATPPPRKRRTSAPTRQPQPPPRANSPLRSATQARRADRRAGLRVRFTTPARYYSPGSKVTTLTVGVDETDWQSLMADARGI